MTSGMRIDMIRQRGFTMVEAIMVIVITGIVGGMVAVFMRAPVQAYFDSADRAELSDAADLALRRMTRDLRLALPNSVRILTAGPSTYLEFLPVTGGGRYLDESDPGPGNILDFTTASTVFDIVGPVPPLAVGSQIVVYNLGPGIEPADAYTGGNRAAFASLAGNTVTLAANPFAAQAPAMRSPGKRFHVVTTPVTYACIPGTGGMNLVRYSGYPIANSQAGPPAGAGAPALMATGVTNCSFTYGAAANVRAALIGLSLTLQRNGEPVTLFHQVHVDNTP